MECMTGLLTRGHTRLTRVPRSWVAPFAYLWANRVLLVVPAVLFWLGLKLDSSRPESRPHPPDRSGRQTVAGGCGTDQHNTHCSWQLLAVTYEPLGCSCQPQSILPVRGGELRGMCLNIGLMPSQSVPNLSRLQEGCLYNFAPKTSKTPVEKVHTTVQ